jgi:hypothetical protein
VIITRQKCNAVGRIIKSFSLAQARPTSCATGMARIQQAHYDYSLRQSCPPMT